MYVIVIIVILVVILIILLLRLLCRQQYGGSKIPLSPPFSKGEIRQSEIAYWGQDSRLRRNDMGEGKRELHCAGDSIGGIFHFFTNFRESPTQTFPAHFLYLI